MKRPDRERLSQPEGVAPRAGARIETGAENIDTGSANGSPPARGRGLKLRCLLTARRALLVAPRAGARIETHPPAAVRRAGGQVAPRAGARIETTRRPAACRS